MGRPQENAEDRFKSFISVGDDGCLNWNGHLDKDGYGTFWNNKDRSSRRAHRYAYEKQFGEIPKGLTIDHLCRNKRCVNPDHLEVVTNRENILRAKKAITHCRNGHELSGYNLYVGPDGNRGCRPCRLAADRRYLERKKLRIVADKDEKVGG